MLSNALTLCLPSLMTKFEGGPPLDLGLKVGWGGFRLRDSVSRKRFEIELWWQLITNRKSYMGFRLQQKSMTLNDLERGRNGRLSSVVLTSYAEIRRRWCMSTRNQGRLLRRCSMVQVHPMDFLLSQDAPIMILAAGSQRLQLTTSVHVL